MVQDARQRTKVWLETYLRNSQLTKDNGSRQASFIVAFDEPDYPIIKVFKTKGVDLIFSIGTPNSTPIVSGDQVVRRYEEHVPFEWSCINKVGIAGTKLRWKATAEVRYVGVNYPTGSQRVVIDERPNDQDLGSTTLFSQKATMIYKRDTT